MLRQAHFSSATTHIKLMSTHRIVDRIRIQQTNERMNEHTKEMGEKSTKKSHLFKRIYMALIMNLKRIYILRWIQTKQQQQQQ